MPIIDVTPYKRAWLLTANLENWQIAENKGVFGCHGNRNFLKNVKKGDCFIAFVPRVGFIGSGTITGEYFVSNIKLWPDKNYNNRFQISSPIILDKVLPAASIIDNLSFVTNKSKWGVFFRSGIREIPQKDFDLISKKISKSASVLSEINKNIQKGLTTTEIGSELHNRVVKLFENLGFTILDSNYSTAGPDIVIVDPEDINKSKILIQCKNSKDKESTFRNLDKHLNEYSGRLKTTNASGAILVISGQSLPKKIPGEKQELDTEEVLQKYGVAVWTDETLEYYEELIEKISRFARYQVLSDLGLKSNFDESIKVDAIKIVQNNYTMFAASIDPDWLLKTATVVRRVRMADGLKGYQRVLDKSRVVNSNKASSISSYIDTNPNWMFPNAVVLASSRKTKLVYNSAKLSLESKYGQFWIIDGQHRLFAFANTEARMKGNKLLCVIIDTESLSSEKKEERELAQIFVTLNGRVKKVPKALLYELYELLGSGDDVSLEVVLKLAKEDFFSDCIRGYSDKGGSINLVAFADAKGTDSIYKYFESKNIKKSKEDIVDISAEYIVDSFKVIAKVFKKEWEDPDEYFLKTDRGVKGVLELLNKILIKYGSKSEDLSKIIEALKKSEFDFSSETAKGLYLGAGGPDKLAKAFSARINKVIPEFAPEEFYRHALTLPYLSRYREIDDQYLKDWISRLKGNIRCKMMFIDKSTIKFLGYINKQNVIKVRMFFGKCEEGHEKYVKEGLSELKENGLDIVLTQSQKKTAQKGAFFHERWIGDDEMQIRTEVDLKDNSQRGAHFNINIEGWKDPPELEDFERYWKAAETNKEVEFGYNWGSPEE